MARWRPAPGRRSKPTTCAVWCCRCWRRRNSKSCRKTAPRISASYGRAWAAFASTCITSAATLAASIRLLPARIPSLESLHLPPALAQTRRAAPGPGAGHRSHRLRQDIHARRADRHRQQPAASARGDHRGPGRISARQPFFDHRADRSRPRHTGFRRNLAHIMRQTPDVILVGEMRDAETMSTVLTAAETGHLVLSHAAHQRRHSGRGAHSRFVPRRQPAANSPADIAGPGRRHRATLVPGLDGVSRWPATEILIANDAARAADPQGRRSPAPQPDLRRPCRWHDDHGAIASRAGENQPHRERHRLRPLLQERRFAAVPGVGAPPRIDAAHFAPSGTSTTRRLLTHDGRQIPERKRVTGTDFRPLEPWFFFRVA